MNEISRTKSEHYEIVDVDVDTPRIGIAECLHMLECFHLDNRRLATIALMPSSNSVRLIYEII